jgi:hypothetical protein
MSPIELEQEIQLLEQWLLDQSASSVEQVDAEVRLAELRRSLAAVSRGPNRRAARAVPPLPRHNDR